MNDIKIGRITLSFIFISLGIILMLEKFMGYEIIKILNIFWPIIIVFFGLEIIYSYFYIKSNEKTKKSLDVFSISIILLIVSSLWVGSLPKNNIGYNRYLNNVSEEVILKSNKKIVIDDSNIDVFIQKSSSENIKVKLEGIYHDEKNGDLGSSTKLIKQDIKGQVIKISRNQGSRANSGKKRFPREMKYFIDIPNNTELEVINDYGDIGIKGTKNNINIKSTYGDILIDDTGGNINVENSYGNLRAKNMMGSIFIKSSNGDIFIDSEKPRRRDINLYCDYGNVRIKVPKNQLGKFNMIATYGNIYDEAGFNIIESASKSSINETRKRLKPNYNIRVDNGDIILKSN